MNLYLELYWSFFKIGFFSIGGGYASLPLIEKEIVEYHKWLDISTFTDIITISQMTPGPIAINASTFVGTQVAGFLGAIIATFGCVSPSLIIVLILAKFYIKYKNLDVITNVLYFLRPAVVSLIGAAGVSIVYLAFLGSNRLEVHSLNYISIVLFIISIFGLKKYKFNPIYVMIGCGIFGMLIYNIKC